MNFVRLSVCEQPASKAEYLTLSSLSDACNIISKLFAILEHKIFSKLIINLHITLSSTLKCNNGDAFK